MANDVPVVSKTEQVLVGCKLPHGLYLDLRDKLGNLVERFRLPGNASFTLPNPNRKFKNPTTVSGDTFTPIPKKFWEEWYGLNKNHPAVKSGAIYFAKDRNSAYDMASEHEKENVGFDKIDPDKHGVNKMDDENKPR